MSILFKAVQSSLKSKDGKKKWHPRVVRVGKVIDTQTLGKLVAAKSALSDGDVHSVIRNLVAVIGHELMNSHTVQLDGLGTFTVVMHATGNGVDTFEEVNHRQIKRVTVHFSPAYTMNPGGGTTRALFDGVSFERIDTRFNASPADPVDPEDPEDPTA